MNACSPGNAGAAALRRAALRVLMIVVLPNCYAMAEGLAQAAPPDSQSASLASSTALRPGDTIRLRIWREPDLSGDFTVGTDGLAVLPKVGPIVVTGALPDVVRERLVRAYAVYLVNPSIEVQVLRRVQVLGAVRNPGLYSLDPSMTVADALALAGGVSGQGRSNKIELRRGGESIPARISGRTAIGDLPIRSGDQLFVPERSWLSRNPGFIIGVLGLAGTVIWKVTD